MVSTRGPRYRFGEGERVLCYEPDPTKAKVLYDSKVLEVIESKDKRGRRTVEYLIHFQGWNSSWDRCVSEDFVLKDTEENRQLQRDLADKSQLQLGAYLYRRERKKGSGSTSGGGNTSSGGGAGNGPGPAKRARHSGNFDDDDSSTSTPNDEGDTDSSSGGSGSGASQAAAPPPPSAQGRAHIALPSPLRDRLTFDYHLVVKRGRLSALPASPCVAEILESFVRWFARAGAWAEPGGRAPRPRRAPPSTAQRPDLQDVGRRLNLVREVADGLRIYFDYCLRGYLLYKQELNQYHETVGKFLGTKLALKWVPRDPELPPTSPRHAPEPIVKTEPVEESDGTLTIKQEPVEPGEEEPVLERAIKEEVKDEEAERQEDDIIMSPKMQEYSHLPPDPEDLPSVPSTQQEVPTETAQARTEPESPAAEEPAPTSASRTRDSRSKDAKPDSVARRLRSHKNSVTSQPDTSEEPTPSTSQAPETAQRATDPPTARSSASSERRDSESSLGEGWWYRRPSVPPLDLPTARTPLPALLEKVDKWHIIPREGTEQMPCRMYGAVHLSRLFVKLPDFLNAIHMPDAKLKLLLKHIDMFVQYLDEHSEWFGETYYIADNMSRSH